MEEERDQISRRRMLKRIGAGAAVVWSAPVLTSLSAPAWAQFYPTCEGCGPDHDCADQIDCSREGSGACGCGRTPNETCFCYQHGACGPLCESQADCAEGTVCVASCCGFTCLGPCEDPARRVEVPRGQRATYPR